MIFVNRINSGNYLQQMSKRSERQGHGFEYEDTILKRFGINKCKNYISEYDAICGNINIQVKCIKHGCAIELGDYFRNKKKQDDFLLILGFWKGNKKNIIEEHIYMIDAGEFTNNLKYEKDNEILTEMKLITNLKVDDIRWKEFCKKHKDAWKSLGNNIDIRFKRDHKTQKRIQCAIPWKNYNQWFKKTFTELSSEAFEKMVNDI